MAEEIGIATTKVADDTQLTTIIGKGDYDMFDWGWTPFVDPDPMLSYFTCDQVSSDPEDPTNYYNDANYCDPEYDKLYQQQKVELDRDKREQIVHEMLTPRRSGTYVLYTEPELQAYRKGASRASCGSRRRSARSSTSRPRRHTPCRRAPRRAAMTEEAAARSSRSSPWS